jgi:dihydrodiol dehydrogenase / D-xylose 1-dehydrogenase (NADP)
MRARCYSWHCIVPFLVALASMAHASETKRPVRWGVMGTGTIASDFVRVLKEVPDAEVAAIGSRTGDRAAAFAAALGVEGATLHGSYEALASDESIDIVYIATPSARHVSDSLACLEAGRSVLCEKSMASSAEEAARVLECARSKQLFFLHGVWSRFFPAMAEVRRLIDSGAIGQVRSVHASFCQNDGAGSCSAMAETGIYCAQLLLWAYGGVAPSRVLGVQRSVDPTSGHDTHVSALLEWPCGGVGTFECSLSHPSPRAAVICGTEGVIELPFPFWCPASLTVQTMGGLGSQTFGDKLVTHFALPEIADAEALHFVHSQGLFYEAAAATACLQRGELETEQFGSAECLRVMQLLSQIRAQWELDASSQAAA